MQTPIDASQVYAFLRRNYRVSRNTRALWQFQQIHDSKFNRVRIATSEQITQSSDEIVLLSALDHQGEPIPPSSTIICTRNTRFSYFTTRYKFAFILDMTDSCATVSIDGGHIYMESLTNCLCILLYSLAQTFTLPGCELRFLPEIDISVYVYFPLHRTPSHQVLIHGYRLTWSTLESVCRDIIANLKEATDLLHNVLSIAQTFNNHSTPSTMDSDDNINSHLNSVYSNSESSCAIINMLSYGITTLQLMPEESTAALVIITDGILDVPNLMAFEAVMRQIRARIISCSFVQIGSNSQRSYSKDNKTFKAPIGSLGNVPNEELLKFISLSTFGSFIHFDVDHISEGSTLLSRLFSGEFELVNVCKRLNDFQHELLSWGFHKAVADSQLSLSKQPFCMPLSIDEENLRNAKLDTSSLHVSRRLVNQTVLQTSLENVLSVRLREGYTVKDVQIDSDEIRVDLVLPWRYDIQIYYTARSIWPLDKSIRTDIRVCKEAPSYFLQELTHSMLSQSSKIVNLTRNNLIRRYNDVIQTVSVTDRHLTLINTFAQNASYYCEPEPVKRGKPVFNLSQNNLQQTVLNVKDEGRQDFANFWRPIVILDGSLWQRFMYTHNLTIILANDPPNKSPFLMSNHPSQSHNQQHSMVSCRMAKLEFESFLSDYFWFVLLDGQAYIQFLKRDPGQQVPYSFMLLRIMGQPPLLYLKFAFQANATTVERHKIIEDFRSHLLRFRSRSRVKSGNVSENGRKQQTSTPVSSSASSLRSLAPSSIHSLQRLGTTCCVVLNKNIERLMLKPDPFPYDSLGIQKPDDDDLQHKNRTELDSKRQALSKFFYIRTFVRSFESIKHSSNIPKRIADIILDTFIRRRLQEGFHFAISHNNIHNLVLEVKMNAPRDEPSKDAFRLNPDIGFYPDERGRTCLVQYRIYPVEYGRSTDTSPLRENRAALLRRSSSIYSDQPTSYYFLTQCWIEPQDGTVDTNCPELAFLNGCTYKQIVDKIGEVDRQCFNTLVSFYFVKYLQERNASLPRPVLRAPRALTADIVRVPFAQETINLIHRSHQCYFKFFAFVDDYEKIRSDYIQNDGVLTNISLNSTFLYVLTDRLCSKTYVSKPQLFLDIKESNNAFTRSLITRSMHSKVPGLPMGLESLKSNPYLMYLLHYDEQDKCEPHLTPLEHYLIEVLFPNWEFLVCAEGDEYVYMALLPRSERDLFLLNTDLTQLMHDLIAQYSRDHIDHGLPIYDDCRAVMNAMLSQIEAANGDRPQAPLLSAVDQYRNDANAHQDPQIGVPSQRRRQRRETFSSADLFLLHGSPTGFTNGKGTTSSSPIPISHALTHYTQHASSQPITAGYRRVHSPLTIDANGIVPTQSFPRRYSAFDTFLLPDHAQNLHAAPKLNVIPPSPHLHNGQDNFKNFNVSRWHIPILLYGCNKMLLSSSLQLTDEQQLRSLWIDTYIDCTKDDNGSTHESMTTTTTSITVPSFKSRKRDTSRRHEDDLQFPHEKQVDDMRDSLDYAFATAFYRNCLLDLTTHRSDVEYALGTIYQEHYEDIDLTPFMRAMCSHVIPEDHCYSESPVPCEPTTKHISSYLNEKFLEIIGQYFSRVSLESEYFYFCTEEERSRQTRSSVEMEDRTNNHANGVEATPTSGPYKFDETNGDDQKSERDDQENGDGDNDDDEESVGTVHIYGKTDDDELELQLGANRRRRSDVSSSSMSNRSRELSGRGDILPLFLCFACRLVVGDDDYCSQVKSIPLCLSSLLPNDNKIKLTTDPFRVSFSLICLTFGREEPEPQGSSIIGTTSNKLLSNHLMLSNKRYQELNNIDAVENTSTCTGTTMVGDGNKNPLDKLRLSEAQRRAVSSCRREIEWLLRDEQLSTYFTRRSLDKRLIENVIEHVQSSVNINKSNCLCRSIDLTFVLGIGKSIPPFLEELKHIRIREKFLLTKCGKYIVLLEPIHPDSASIHERRLSALATHPTEDSSSSSINEDSIVSDGSTVDDDEDSKSTDDELDDYVKPSFWLFIEREKKTTPLMELLEVKFYLYCGSSSDTTQKSCEPQAILDELIDEFNRLCRTINQKLLLSDLGASKLCNPLLVPPSESDGTTVDSDVPVLAANLSIEPGTFACDELWTHSFPLHFRLWPHLHGATNAKTPVNHNLGSLSRELGTRFSSLAVHNRKNLFVYCGKLNDYYMRFREDYHPASAQTPLDDSLVLSESQHIASEPPSPQISNASNALKSRQRHDSGTSCIHVMLYGLKSGVSDPEFDTLKSNLVQWIVARLEEEVVKELVNAMYHFAMTRLSPDDVSFIRPIDQEAKQVFEYKISPLININVFLYYFRRFVKTNHFHQPLILPVLAKDLKDIVKDYRGQTLLVYNYNYSKGALRPGLAWIELHVLTANNRPSPFSADDAPDDLNIHSFIDLIQVDDCTSSSSSASSIPLASGENILRCHVWVRGSPAEVEPATMSNTLLQTFSFALADYITEYKLLPTLFNNHRHGSLEPPASPRSTATVKFADETTFILDRNVPSSRASAADAAPTTPIVHSRRHSTNSAGGIFHSFTKANKAAGPQSPIKLQRQESAQSSLLSSSSIDEPQSLSIEHADCLTKWFQHLTIKYPKLPSLTSCTHTLNNRILLMDIIHNFTSWLNDQKFIAYKHESLHGMIFRSNQERTLYLPVSSLNPPHARIPGEKLDLIVLYQSSKLVNDIFLESAEPSPQQDSGDAMAQANTADIPKQIFLCIVVNDKKLTLVLHNAPDELSKLLMNYFTTMIAWSNRRLNVLNIIVTQKMGLFRHRLFQQDQHPDFSRHQFQQGTQSKHPVKIDNVELEQGIKEMLPPKTGNIYATWNVDLLYCNLIGSYPPLLHDPGQDLIARHGTQLLQLKENKKIHMDRCTKLEEICSNWVLKPKLFIADDLLTQMKHRSRLLTVAVIPILFSRAARHYFQNDSTLRTSSPLDFETSPAPTVLEGSSVATRMNNKRKSVGFPVDPTLRRLFPSVEETDYQIGPNPHSRIEPTRSSSTDQQHSQMVERVVEHLSAHLQSQYKFHPISTKLISRKVARSIHVQTSSEHNFHRSDPNRRSTLLAEISSLNQMQLVVRFLQYEIAKIPSNHQPTANDQYRKMSNESHPVPEQTELEASVYDFHLQTIINHQTIAEETHLFPTEFSLINFLQDFIEYYPNAPTGSKTALFKTTIRHPLDVSKRAADTNLFKYVLEHAATYNIRATKRNTDEYLFDHATKDIYWMAARTPPSTSSELTVVMYIIYTNLSAKVQALPSSQSASLNKVPIPAPNTTRIANSLKSSTSNNLLRERAATLLLPPMRSNLIVPLRPSAVTSEQPVPSNILPEFNVDHFRAKLISILNKASLSHRRESLWERLIASRPDNPSTARQEIVPISIHELQSLLDSCISDETVELSMVTSLLQRVFPNRDQSDRLNKFLRVRYGSQFHLLSSAAVNYLVIFQCKAPAQCDAFLVLIHRTDQNILKSCLIKHRNDIDCDTFVQVFTQRISYFLWDCLI